MNPSISASFLFGSPQQQLITTTTLFRFTDLLDFFFIAHPESGRKEGEESQRILYFTPNTESIDKQTQITGFAEAVVNFTTNFTSEDDAKLSDYPHRFVGTAKQFHVYLMLESDSFLMGVALNKEKCSTQDYVLHAKTIKAVLITGYRMFRLFFGTFAKLIADGRETLISRLEYFFSRYLHLLRLHQMPLVDLFDGVDFLPLDSVNFLRVENLLGQLKESFPMIDKVLFLYQDRLLSYSIPKNDLAVLFKYLTQNLLKMSLTAELQPEFQVSWGASAPAHRGKFITGPKDLSAEAVIANAKDCKLPVVYLSENENSNNLTPYELIVYRALNATVCMFVSQDVDINFLRDLDAMLGPELSSVASLIGDSVGSLNSELKPDHDFHYVYYNPATLSLKTSFYESSVEPSRLTSLTPLPSAMCRLACDVVDQLVNEGDFGEVSVKAESDWWLIVKRVNGRLLLLFIPNQSAWNLSDVYQYSNDIIKSHFESIFLI
ncbi:hypothetical protein AB6A40_005879 [Gnathostoma spinigerum]|uniref:Uncharacterized protein n=1 Tax=Gnathostoma spinigerum TaxID=75299 RepID=A0ABD6ESD8_9BILA